MPRLILIVALVSAVSAAATGVVSGIVIKGSIDAGNRSFQRKLHDSGVTQQAKLHVAQVNGCHRQNIRQVTVNKNALADYRQNKLFAQALAGPQRVQTAKQRKLVTDFQGRLADTLATLAWTPLNHHCGSHPTAVLLPVTFAQRKPPKSDLRLSKGD